MSSCELGSAIVELFSEIADILYWVLIFVLIFFFSSGYMLELVVRFELVAHIIFFIKKLTWVCFLSWKKV